VEELFQPGEALLVPGMDSGFLDAPHQVTAKELAVMIPSGLARPSFSSPEVVDRAFVGQHEVPAVEFALKRMRILMSGMATSGGCSPHETDQRVGFQTLVMRHELCEIALHGGLAVLNNLTDLSG